MTRHVVACALALAALYVLGCALAVLCVGVYGRAGCGL